MFTFIVSFSPKPDEWPILSNIIPHFAINTIWAAVIFYLFYFYFIRFFEKGLFVKYLIFSIVSSILVTIMFLPAHLIFAPNFPIFNLKIFGPPIVGTFIIAQCGCLIRGFENWFGNNQVRNELENRNLKNELELLKAQVNPHFLFNTLNNIDSLIQKSPADASKALIGLSDMLRYMIYDTKTDIVPLNQELSYIQHYIELQKLRFRQNNYVSSSFSDYCNGIGIAPLLLLPFIENAFKYSYNSGTLPAIEIKISCVDNKLGFYCMNYFNKGSQNIERTGGVGLENVKRRLLLLYPGKHDLKIKEENNTFIVDLTIELS